MRARTSETLICNTFYSIFVYNAESEIDSKNNTKYKIVRKVDLKRPKLKPPELSLSVYGQNFIKNPILTTRTSESTNFDTFLTNNGFRKIDEKQLGVGG